MKKSTIKAIDEFVKLVGGKTWVRWSSTCTGKWAGTTDYGITIDGKVRIWVSNGMRNFESKVMSWIESIKTFNAKKEENLKKIREQADRDNIIAKSEGLKQVKVLDIGFVSPEVTDDFYFFEPFVLLDVDGKDIKYCEGLFSEYLFTDNIDAWIKRCDIPVWTPRWAENPDYIFGSVRRNSESEECCIRGRNKKTAE